MADYFIGDTHFGCEALLSIRTAFRSTQEMDNFILDNWESRVTNNDHVYILIFLTGAFKIQNPTSRECQVRNT